MAQANFYPPQHHSDPLEHGLVVSNLDQASLAELPQEMQLATMRQMMEALFSRIEDLQQNQAVQFAGVHDRLDAVELEIPLVQEQTALRLRDLENKVSAQIEDTANFRSLEQQIAQQRHELAQLRESREQVESRLNRAVLDIERLCGTVASRPAQAPLPPPVEPSLPASPYRSRIAEQIRKAAVSAAPDESNPLLADPAVKRPVSAAVVPVSAPKPEPPKAEAAKPAVQDKVVPGFEDWKRQFMQNGEPLQPTLHHDAAAARLVICPRCYSDRTRPATRTKVDALFRLTGLSPHRCKSCAHRFYKRGPADDMNVEDAAGEEALETR
jgi:hypothetical protein